ncbi:MULTISPECIES: SPFH domain-containing protein [Olivibacter]|jgi:membrane protease subunit (stomatin/prohibitin family)|uniref:SPFH domain-containing protein n=2 Tax=Sphingobacteriaceae TaxID=84566 RepID=A0ABV6HV03_9SPHI|nr:MULTISPECIES: SPFH domain-containing protein [Olivibacter]MCL4639656.1 SPFH domain-containing protein [Olivibacter sp. UJ_SKK_5.1]MDM8174477.1 SPFH domain-containing protein [Olivibacter sp. 47]MDX3916606.1 SPFH domain-containing protein [Pseudosphingobacterium sp.]QEL01229.1 SPFH domain-containing protein [Olivibacter sp. LS-1]
MSNPTSKLPFLEIVEWAEQDPNMMMWKIADGDKEIKNGAKLLVRESQSVLFINEGTIADVFMPGTYTLHTQNVPVLSRLKGWKYGFESPFKADVYYFSVKQFVNLKWGTPAPIMLRDAQFGQVRIRAFGTYNVRITDITRFFKEYAGTYHQLTVFEFERQLRDFIAPQFGEALALSNISVLDIAGNISLLNKKIAPLIQPYFETFGIEITQFTVTSATLPDEVTQYYDKVTGMNMVSGDVDRFQKFNTAIAISQESSPAQQGAQQGIAMGILMGQMQATQQNQTNSKINSQDNTVNSSETQDESVVKLKKIKTLFESGLIDEDEYKAKKAEILSKL